MVAAFKDAIAAGETPDTRGQEEDTKCTVFGASLTGNDWMSQHSNVISAAFCHENCLKTKFCRFWTRRSDSKLCYLKNDDGPIVKDNFAVSGTTITRLECNRPLSDSHIITQDTRCSCKTDPTQRLSLRQDICVRGQDHLGDASSPAQHYGVSGERCEAHRWRARE